MKVGPNELDNAVFGQYLNDIRTSKRISRKEAGRRIGVTSEYIRLIERGERVPALGTVRNLLDSYNVPYVSKISGLIIESEFFEFTSRIKEARNYKPSKLSRDALIGQIVQSLSIADDDTLKQIHSKLTTKYTQE